MWIFTHYFPAKCSLFLVMRWLIIGDWGRAVLLKHGGFLWMQDWISGVEVGKMEGEYGQLRTRLPVRPGKSGWTGVCIQEGRNFFPFPFFFSVLSSSFLPWQCYILNRKVSLKSVWLWLRRLWERTGEGGGGEEGGGEKNGNGSGLPHLVTLRDVCLDDIWGSHLES